MLGAPPPPLFQGQVPPGHHCLRPERPGGDDLRLQVDAGTDAPDAALDDSPFLADLTALLGLVALVLVAVLSVLTFGGVALDNKLVGALFLLGGLALVAFAVYTMYELARYFFNPDLSAPRQRRGDRQRRELTIQVAVVLEVLYFLGIAAVHAGIYVLDNSSWSNIASVLQGTTNYWQLYWIALLDSIIAAIGAASATRFVVRTVAAQVWLVVGVYLWRLETVLLFTNVVAAEFARRERRRDLDPETF